MSRILSQADEENFIWLSTRKIELNFAVTSRTVAPHIHRFEKEGAKW